MVLAFLLLVLGVTALVAVFFGWTKALVFGQWLCVAVMVLFAWVVIDIAWLIWPVMGVIYGVFSVAVLAGLLFWVAQTDT